MYYSLVVVGQTASYFTAVYKESWRSCPYTSCLYWSLVSRVRFPMVCQDPSQRGKTSQIAKFMGPTWGPHGPYRPQMGPMLAQWTLLSGVMFITSFLIGWDSVYVTFNNTWTMDTVIMDIFSLYSFRYHDWSDSAVTDNHNYFISLLPVFIFQII